MNIQNPELIKRLGTFPNLYTLVPVLTSYGLIPADFSRGVVGEPAILRLIAEEFTRLIDFSEVDVVAGIDLSVRNPSGRDGQRSSGMSTSSNRDPECSS